MRDITPHDLRCAVEDVIDEWPNEQQPQHIFEQVLEIPKRDHIQRAARGDIEHRSDIDGSFDDYDRRVEGQARFRRAQAILRALDPAALKQLRDARALNSVFMDAFDLREKIRQFVADLSGPPDEFEDELPSCRQPHAPCMTDAGNKL